uniref:39S ribosomal protein L37, mitochondrial n=1 Tax=Parascaris univalens TaxID=6257 RepID=A0A915B1S9_PARUN
MVFQKYRPSKQWGKMDTRIFKAILEARNKRKMPSFQVPDALKALGVEVYDPNSPDFPTPRELPSPVIDHPAFKVNTPQDHPLYKAVKCALFDGTEPFTDGIDQACALTNAVRRPQFPSSIAEKASKIQLPRDFEGHLRDLIMHGERYDPTLEKLPKRHDPVLFWIRHPRVYGTPVVKKNNIVLDNLYRSILLTAIQHDQLEFLRCDRDEPLSGALNFGGEFEKRPFVIRCQPHLVIQSPVPIQPWADKDEVNKTKEEMVPDVTPIDPRIDLTEDNIYNTEAVVPRNRFHLHLDTIMWTREQDQKYPWTREQNAANAVMYCFCAALVEATRKGIPSSSLLATPVTTRAVQIVDGRLDLVVFQLNTLDLSRASTVKNIVWVEPDICRRHFFTRNISITCDVI